MPESLKRNDQKLTLFSSFSCSERFWMVPQYHTKIKGSNKARISRLVQHEHGKWGLKDLCLLMVILSGRVLPAIALNYCSLATLASVLIKSMSLPLKIRTIFALEFEDRNMTLMKIEGKLVKTLEKN